MVETTAMEQNTEKIMKIRTNQLKIDEYKTKENIYKFRNSLRTFHDI